MEIRHIRPTELLAAHRFVQSVVNETYAYIWRPVAPPIDETDWPPAWVVDDGASIIALMLTSNDWVDDLWVAASHRGLGTGSALLGKAEDEIVTRGHRRGLLRLVSGNNHALDFYKCHGWSLMRTYRHERLSIDMIDLEKPLR